jgi:hypothetical protein
VLVTGAISPLELHVNQRRRATTIHSLHAKAAGPKEFFVIDGATHLDLYDGEGVDLAMNKLSPFFKKEPLKDIPY